MEQTNETELVRLLQDEKHRKEAFAQVVNLYSPQLYAQIRRLVLTHDNTNDILQETFLKAWVNLAYFRAEAKLSTWLYRIALNESLTFLNKQKVRQNLSVDDPDMTLANKLESDPYFEGDQAQLMLQKAILTLPDKQRMVFNLKYFQDMKYEDMSEIFGTTVGALKASYHHAVKKIALFLKETV